MAGALADGQGCNMPGTIRSYPFHIIAKPTRSATPAGEAVEGLRQALREAGSTAEVVTREEDRFAKSTAIFNGAVHTQAYACVRPKSAYDVSKTVIYCRKTGLELSVKAGGTGVHGWSVSGHIVLDLSLLTQTSVSLPSEPITLHESFESLQIADSNKRPSLADTATSGSSSTMTSKRSASAALDSREDGRGKRKMGLEDILESGSGPAIQVESPVDEQGGSPSSGDVIMSSSGDDISRESSKASSAADASESSRRSSSGAGAGGSSSTPPTSVDMADPFAHGWRRPSVAGSSSSGSGSSNHAQARTTYVNPSPTATTSFPFIPTSFGPSSSTQTLFSTGFPSASQSLNLNTNPDPPAYTLVTFGAGTTSKMLDAATAASPYGAFYVPTSAFPVGSGQFLSGGFGFIGRKHGLAMDNLVEAEMVLADGRIIWVGENGKHQGEWRDDEDPDEVWWGLRGAGATLGVITRFRAKAYYLPSIYAGNLIFAFNHSTTPSLLRHVRDCIKGSPRTLYCNIIMTAGPPNAPGIVVIQLCFSGSRAEGEMYVQAMSSWEGGRSIFQDFSERTFERQQVAVEEILKGGQGRKWYIKSDMLMSLNDEVIDKTCEKFHAVPDGCTWLFEFTGGGAVADVKDSCFPSSHRESAFTVAALHQWGHDETPVEDSRCVTTAEDWINDVIHPHGPGGPLPCFLQESDEASVAAVYGENYERLKALKHKVDPDNFFRHAMWPHPSGHDEELQSLHADNAKGKTARASAQQHVGRTTAGDGRTAETLTAGRAKTMAELNNLQNDLSFNKSQTIENVAIDAFRTMAGKSHLKDGKSFVPSGDAQKSGNGEGNGTDQDGGRRPGGPRMMGNIPDGPDGTLVVDMDIRLSKDPGMKEKGFGPPQGY